MTNLKEVNLFVPGRICIVGELSDWVSDYKLINNDINEGVSIVTAIDLGIYANVKPSQKLIFNMNDNHFEIQMNEKQLLAEAQSFSFYSYICGVALHMKRKYDVGGLQINVKKCTLPIKKGLSSSAAIIILIVEAYNELYKLGLNDNEIMEDAYISEHLALSQCGRLDQLIVVSRNNLTKATFYNDCVAKKEVFVKKELNFVIADLCAEKNTRKILDSLRGCYPFAKNKKEQMVHDVLEIENREIVELSAKAIEEGNLKELGKLMCIHQDNLFKAGIPICSEFKAPVLTKTLNDKFIKKHSYGAKGMGSNGDGSILVLAKDKKSQEKILDYLNNKLNMNAFKYNVCESHKVKKAIIPLAGFATRLYPVSRAIKKSFVPIYTDGTFKPLIQKLVEDLDKAGIDEICFIIGKNDEEIYNNYFRKSLPIENFNKLSEEEQTQELNLLRIGEKIKYVIQEEPKGFGHAIHLCKDFINNDPVLICLGDTYYTSDSDITPIEQMINFYDENEKNIVAIQAIDDDEIESVGITYGNWEEDNELNITKMVEKPNISYAKEELSYDGVCFGNFGMWIVDKHVLSQLESNILNDIKNKGEFGFVEAISDVIPAVDVRGLLIDGKSHDIGNLNTYKKTLIEGLKDK